MADDGYGKYRKMLKMGIPRLQVETAMRMDGKDLSKFSEQDPNEGGPVGESGGMDLSMKGDVYDKYRKMLKCGLPMGAAMQAMAKDGVDPKGFDISGGGGSAPSSDAPPPPAPSPQVDIRETSNDSGSGGGFLNELKAKAEKTVSSGSTPTKTMSSPTKTIARAPAMSPPKPVAVTPPPVPLMQKTTSPEKSQFASSSTGDKSAAIFRSRNASPKGEPSSSEAEAVSDTPVPEIPKPQEIESSKPDLVIESPKQERPSPPPVPKVSPFSSKSSLASSLAMPSYRVVTATKPISPEVEAPGVVSSPPASVAASVADIPIPRQETFRAAEEVLSQVLTSDSTANVADELTVQPQTRVVPKPIGQQETSSPAAATKKWTAPAKTTTSGIGTGDWKTLMAANKISSSPPAKTESEPSAEIPLDHAVRLETASPNVETKRDSPTTTPRESIPSKPSVPAVTSTSARTVAPPKQAVPVSSTASKPATTPAPAAARTLKKRHSNDYKTMLAPFIDPPKGPQAVQQRSTVPTEVAKPVIQSPPPPVIPRPISSSGPVNASANRGVNDVGLKTQQRLPAWAAVEKPSFLVKEDGASPKMSQSSSATPSVRTSTPVTVNKSPVATSTNSAPKTIAATKTVTSAPVTSPAQEQKPKAAVVMQPATGSIPKGFQRRFAWEQ